MYLPVKYLIFILFMAVLAACETVPVVGQSDATRQGSAAVSAQGEIPANPAIDQAQSELERVKSMGSEWFVRLPDIGANPISLSGIMALALMFHKNGEAEKATEYAQIVSKFSQLVITQAHQQSDAQPFYPQ